MLSGPAITWNTIELRCFYITADLPAEKIKLGSFVSSYPGAFKSYQKTAIKQATGFFVVSEELYTRSNAQAY